MVVAKTVTVLRTTVVLVVFGVEAVTVICFIAKYEHAEDHAFKEEQGDA